MITLLAALAASGMLAGNESVPDEATRRALTQMKTEVVKAFWRRIAPRSSSKAAAMTPSRNGEWKYVAAFLP